ncbi:MAG: hypothetical protein ACLP70_12400 [Streptosporangiaceae bacterium]
MKDQEFRRHDRHEAGPSGCQHGDDSPHPGEDEPRRTHGGGWRRGPGRGGFPAGPPGFRGPGPWARGPRMRGPWDAIGETGTGIQLRALTRQLAMAASQVAGSGTDAQQAQASQILADSRRSLYQILASSEDEATAQQN